MSRFLSPTLSAVTPYTPGEQPQDMQYQLPERDERQFRRISVCRAVLVNYLFADGAESPVSIIADDVRKITVAGKNCEVDYSVLIVSLTVSCVRADQRVPAGFYFIFFVLQGEFSVTADVIDKLIPFVRVLGHNSPGGASITVYHVCYDSIWHLLSSPVTIISHITV